MHRHDDSTSSTDSPAEHLYTTPANMWAPLYGPPPHIFSSATYVRMVARAPSGVLRSLVPHPLECSTDLFSVFWSCFDVCAAGPSHVYQKAHVLDFAIPVTYQGLKGNQCTIEYIDITMGQVVGRELWGYPKKRGTFSWQQSDSGFDLKCFAEDGALLADSLVSLAPNGAPPPEWPAELRDHQNAPTLQVMISRKLGTDTPVRADVLRIDRGVPSDGKSYPVASIRGATGTLNLHDGPFDPLTKLGPLEVLAVSVGSDISFSFPHGVAIGSVNLPAAGRSSLVGVQ